MLFDIITEMNFDCKTLWDDSISDGIHVVGHFAKGANSFSLRCVRDFAKSANGRHKCKICLIVYNADIKLLNLAFFDDVKTLVYVAANAEILAEIIESAAGNIADDRPFFFFGNRIHNAMKSAVAARKD